LLRIVAGLEQLSFGEVAVARDDNARPINSMIFQEQSLFPWMTVRDNVAYGLRMRGVPKRTLNPVVDGYLAKVGLSRFANAFPHQLSGGMKQRVSIARAFANDPEILLRTSRSPHSTSRTRFCCKKSFCASGTRHAKRCSSLPTASTKR
jgi:NitT/TauT family transport system ATP-binding protein